MNVIDKILEEIDEKIEHVQKAFINNENMPGCLLYKKTMEEAKDIIRKHMNDAEYPYITEKDVESVPTANKEFLAECREVAEKYGKNDGWILVAKELPPNAKHKGTFCPKYQVMTKYGVTEGWYNPDYESWFCLFWFADNKFTKPYIDFEHGDVPKRVRIEKGSDIVLAWRPLPEPYKPERRNEE